MKTTVEYNISFFIKVMVVIINSLLVVQYMLGILLNLFYNIPFDTVDLKKGSFIEKTGLAFGYARTSAITTLQLHWLNASILILASFILLILGIKAGKTLVWVLTLILVLIFSVATISGAAFIAYAGNNYYSFSMATAFIIASIISVCLLLYSLLTKNDKK